jgi:hypothetical protein
MAIRNLKLIALTLLLAQLLFSCKPTRFKSIVRGKNIPIELQYNKTFKLGDTLFLSFKCSVTDLENSINSPVGDFKTYTVLASPTVTKKDTFIVPDAGKYVKIISDIPQISNMYYNTSSGNFECKYGYIPFRKGTYQIQGSIIEIFPNTNKYPSWRLQMYFEGDNPETSGNKEFEVE